MGQFFMSEVTLNRIQHPLTPEKAPALSRNAWMCLCCGNEAGSYLRLIASCITQLTAQGPSRTCNESTEEEEEVTCVIQKGLDVLVSYQRGTPVPYLKKVQPRPTHSPKGTCVIEKGPKHIQARRRRPDPRPRHHPRTRPLYPTPLNRLPKRHLHYTERPGLA